MRPQITQMAADPRLVQSIRGRVPICGFAGLKPRPAPVHFFLGGRSLCASSCCKRDRRFSSRRSSCYRSRSSSACVRMRSWRKRTFSFSSPRRVRCWINSSCNRLLRSRSRLTGGGPAVGGADWRACDRSEPRCGSYPGQRPASVPVTVPALAQRWQPIGASHSLAAFSTSSHARLTYQRVPSDQSCALRAPR